MRIPGLGLEIRRTRRRQKQAGLTSLTGTGGWWPLVHEPMTGGWQRNVPVVSTQETLTNPTAWACVTLIAADGTTTTVQVVRLATDPRCLVEINAIAVID